MKTKQIYEIALKIGGIVAAWKVIESLILFGIMIVTFSSMPTFGGLNSFAMSQVNYMSIYLIVAYALFAFFLLFRTEKIMELLKLNNQDDAELHIERKVFYHVLVLAVGFCMFIYSANHIVTKTYSNNNTTNTNYNYISMLLVLISLVIIFKSVRISDFFLAKLKDDEVSS